MSKIEWKDEYSVGVTELDRQHRKLFELINRLTDQAVSHSTPGDHSEVLDELIRYALEHLEYEESFLKRHAFPDIDNHKEKHELYLERFNTLLNTSGNEENVFSDELINFLQQWWKHHVLEEDMKYKAFFTKEKVA